MLRGSFSHVPECVEAVYRFCRCVSGLLHSYLLNLDSSNVCAQFIGFCTKQQQVSLSLSLTALNVIIIVGFGQSPTYEAGSSFWPPAGTMMSGSIGQNSNYKLNRTSRSTSRTSISTSTSTSKNTSTNT